MSCGRDCLGGRARGGRPLPEWACGPFLHDGHEPKAHGIPHPLTRGLGGEFEGRAGEYLRKTSPGPPLNTTPQGGERPGTSGPWPSPQNPSYGLDFGSRYVKLVYPRGQGGFGRRRLDSITFYRDYLVRAQERLEIDWERLGLGVWGSFL